jgi:hypothetical protein
MQCHPLCGLPFKANVFLCPEVRPLAYLHSVAGPDRVQPPPRAVSEQDSMRDGPLQLQSSAGANLDRFTIWEHGPIVDETARLAVAYVHLQPLIDDVTQAETALICE